MAFTQVQNGTTQTGSSSGNVTTITLSLPSASTAGTLLIASFVLGAAGFPLKIATVTTTTSANPNTAPGWEWCGTAVNGSGGGGEQVEIWCYRKNPGNINSTTWTMANGGGARGHIAEYSSTLAYQVMELFPGVNTAVGGAATSFPVSMTNAVGSGELAVATFGGNYSPSTNATWTTPGGWTLNRDTSGSTFALHWASYYQTTAAAGAVSVTGVISTAANQVGWEALVVVFREASSVRARVGASCSAGTYNDQASFGFPATKVGSAKEFDTFVGRTMSQSAQVSYQQEGAHLSGGPTSDQQALYAAGVQIVWALKPNRTGAAGFTSLAAEQAAVDSDISLMKQSGINGFICDLYHEHNLGGGNGPFGNDVGGSDPYGNVGTGAAASRAAQQNWLAYWAHYAPTLTAHGIPVYARPSYASPPSCSSWHPPAGTVSGVIADFYYSDSNGKSVYLDQSPGNDPGTGNVAPALQDVCDGTKNPDNTAASNPPIPLGLGEIGRSAGGTFPAWSSVVAWSHTGGSTGHVRDLFAARLTANKQNAPIIWFENNLGAPNWIHTPGVNGEDQSGIQAELAAWVDNLAPQATGTTVVVTTTSLANAVLGSPYNVALQVTGGSAPYTWAVLTGTLPTGLSLSSGGVITGTPTVAGTYTFTVKATDSSSNIGNSGSLSIVVPGLSITTTTLPPASVGVAYTQTLTESGGTGPFTWGITADSVLPMGITLSTAGVLSGTSGDVPAAYGFTAVVTDSLSATATAGLTLTLSPGVTGGGGPPAVLPAGFPRVIIEAGFYASAPVATPGTFILDHPVFGQLDANALGDATVWTDITTYARSATVTRTSTRVQGPLRTYQAGTASVVLKNGDGRFDPDNLSGAYVTGGVSSIRPMVPVRARAIYAGVEYHLFTGFIDTWATPDTNWGSHYSETTASATDGFKVLAGITIPANQPSGSGELSGSRIQRILNAAAWYTDHRNIADGDSEMQTTKFGDTAMNLLQLTADSEIGELYIDGAGFVTFRERQAVLEDTRSTTSQATFSDALGATLPYLGVARADDDTTLANDVQITAANSSNMQEAQNAASIAKYLFPRTYARSDVLLTSDAEALTYAQWVLRVSLDGADRFDTLTIAPLRNPAALFPQVLSREIGDRITIVRNPPNAGTITKDVFIRGITHTVDVSSNTWQTQWDLDSAAKYSGYLILDDTTKGKLSSGNRLAY